VAGEIEWFEARTFTTGNDDYGFKHRGKNSGQTGRGLQETIEVSIKPINLGTNVNWLNYNSEKRSW
jgi:hypothetical protein